MPRRPDMPCGVCGALMWRSATSLPDGEARCRPCRKAARCGTVNGYRKGCRCAACRAAINAEAKEYRARRRDEGRPILRRDDGWISKADREMVYFRDDYTCQICRRPVDMTAHYMAPNAPTLDHIEPRWMGGTDDLWNLRLACRECNTKRGPNPDWEVSHVPEAASR